VAFAERCRELRSRGMVDRQWCEDEWHGFKRVQTRALRGGRGSMPIPASYCHLIAAPTLKILVLIAPAFDA
jgi:hypothetical protein